MGVGEPQSSADFWARALAMPTARKSARAAAAGPQSAPAADSGPPAPVPKAASLAQRAVPPKKRDRAADNQDEPPSVPGASAEEEDVSARRPQRGAASKKHVADDEPQTPSKRRGKGKAQQPMGVAPAAAEENQEDPADEEEVDPAIDDVVEILEYRKKGASTKHFEYLVRRADRSSCWLPCAGMPKGMVEQWWDEQRRDCMLKVISHGPDPDGESKENFYEVEMESGRGHKATEWYPYSFIPVHLVLDYITDARDAREAATSADADAATDSDADFAPTPSAKTPAAKPAAASSARRSSPRTASNESDEQSPEAPSSLARDEGKPRRRQGQREKTPWQRMDVQLLLLQKCADEAPGIFQYGSKGPAWGRVIEKLRDPDLCPLHRFKWDDTECKKNLKKMMADHAKVHNTSHPKGSSGRAGAAASKEEQIKEKLLAQLVEAEAEPKPSKSSGGRSSSGGAKRARERDNAKHDKYMEGGMFSGKPSKGKQKATASKGDGFGSDEDSYGEEGDAAAYRGDSVGTMQYYKDEARKRSRKGKKVEWWEVYLDEFEEEHMEQKTFTNLHGIQHNGATATIEPPPGYKIKSQDDTKVVLVRIARTEKLYARGFGLEDEEYGGSNLLGKAITEMRKARSGGGGSSGGGGGGGGEDGRPVTELGEAARELTSAQEAQTKARSDEARERKEAKLAEVAAKEKVELAKIAAKERVELAKAGFGPQPSAEASAGGGGTAGGSGAGSSGGAADVSWKLDRFGSVEELLATASTSKADLTALYMDKLEEEGIDEITDFINSIKRDPTGKTLEQRLTSVGIKSGHAARMVDAFHVL